MLFAYRGLGFGNVCTANVTFFVSILILMLCALRRLRSLKLCSAVVAKIVLICVNVLCAFGLTTPSPQATRSKCCHKHTAYDQKC
jgi:hypothetical protein